ncbi:hypothetical protein [Lewinella sp. W8]|uniref:hypothetical protein n=1 Tax=Lewinella sp. W8 TaxID=2528208 RepID=UPI0010684D1E|nr:hypothetical protein [Lewinella sp. W8]MTB49872.1 hypothetical protein [Lewinella sp. W8]
MKVYLDDLRAGHAYIELLPAGSDDGDVYGFYPAKFDEKKEVLLGEGQLRKDRTRLEKNRAAADVRQIAKTIPLSGEEFERLKQFLAKQEQNPSFYFLVGYNCIDFLEDAYAAAKEQPEDKLMDRYSDDELDELGYVGTYAKWRFIGG